MSFAPQPSASVGAQHRALSLLRAATLGGRSQPQRWGRAKIPPSDGRVIGVLTVWFPLLRAATAAQREIYEIGGGGVSLYWPETDEDLSVTNLLAGADRRST